jgi:DNA polymerase-4
LVVVAPGDERSFLAPLSVAKLWGVGPVTQQQLERAGLCTIGDVQRLGEAPLHAAFGSHLGAHLHTLAHGLDPREVEVDRQAKSIGHEMTFVDDLHDPDTVRGVLLQLAEMVGRRLRRDGRRGRVVKLKLRYGDFTTLVRQRQVPPTHDDLALHRTAVALLDDAWDRSRGVRLLGITAAQLVSGAAPVQAQLFAPPPGKRDRLLAAMDAIRDRHGEAAVRHATERRSTTPFGPASGPPEGGG